MAIQHTNSGLALIASLALGYVLAPLHIPGAINFWAPAHFLNMPNPAPTAIHAALGAASVSAQGNIGAHFSQRREIYLYPHKAKEVDAIVLWLDSPTTKLYPQDPGKDASLAWRMQMRPAEYLASAECLLSHGNYRVALWQDPWLVLRKETSNPTADPSLDDRIRQKLQHLRVGWQVEVEEYRDALQRCGKPKEP